MAKAMAVEWDAQDEKVDPQTMPVTRSANAAIDKVAVQHAEVADLVGAYGAHDLLCYRAEIPTGLQKRQAQAWDPVLEWAAGALGVQFNITTGLVYKDQPPEAMMRLRNLVFERDAFNLTALHDLVCLSGSLIIGLATCHQAFEVEDLWNRARVDEVWQAEQWGHDAEAQATEADKRSAFLQVNQFLKSLF